MRAAHPDGETGVRLAAPVHLHGAGAACHRQVDRALQLEATSFFPQIQNTSRFSCAPRKRASRMKTCGEQASGLYEYGERTTSDHSGDYPPAVAPAAGAVVGMSAAQVKRHHTRHIHDFLSSATTTRSRTASKETSSIATTDRAVSSCPSATQLRQPANDSSFCRATGTAKR